MNHHDPSKNIGGLVISEEVLAAIAVTAARDVEGVSALLPRYADVSRLLKGEHLRFVKISSAPAGLAFELSLRVRADVNVCAVAGEVQRGVKNAVQSMAGKAVTQVNLKVLGVDFDPSK